MALEVLYDSIEDGNGDLWRVIREPDAQDPEMFMIRVQVWSEEKEDWDSVMQFPPGIRAWPLLETLFALGAGE